jgi:hypothetical protein
MSAVWRATANAPYAKGKKLLGSGKVIGVAPILRAAFLEQQEKAMAVRTLLRSVSEARLLDRDFGQLVRCESDLGGRLRTASWSGVDGERMTPWRSYADWVSGFETCGPTPSPTLVRMRGSGTVRPTASYGRIRRVLPGDTTADRTEAVQEDPRAGARQPACIRALPEHQRIRGAEVDVRGRYEATELHGAQACWRSSRSPV